MAGYLATQSVHRSAQVSCTRCHLHKSARTVCVPPRGAARPIVLFVGEAPGKTEDRLGSPFVGDAGKLLDDLMSRAGLDPSLCRWTNTVRCLPPGETKAVRPPTEEERDACSMHLESDIRATRPVFIVPLGGTATSYFFGRDVKISQVRGKRYVVDIPTVRYRYVRMMQVLGGRGVQDDKLFQSTPGGRERAIKRAITHYGYKDLPTQQYTMFPTWHPAAVLYGNRSAEYDIIADLNFLVSKITGDDGAGDYKLVTSVEEALKVIRDLRADFREGRFPYLSYDVESTSLKSFDPRERLITFALSAYKGEAYTFPWDHHESPFRGDMLVQKAITAELNQTFEEVPVVGHNIKYDYEYSAVRGIWIRQVYDDSELMAWTLTNDQSPHGLDYLTSKYTDLKLPKQEMKQAQDALPKDERYNMDNYELDLVARYNGADTDSVIRLVPTFETEMKKAGLYEAHKYYVVGAILPTIDMEINGCPIDRDMHTKLYDEMTADIQDCYEQLERYGVTEAMERHLNEGSDSKRKKEFKLSSPIQVSTLLFELLGLKPRKLGSVRKTGALKGQRVPSSDKHVLQELLEEANDQVSQLENKPDFNPDAGEYQYWVLCREVVSVVQKYKQTEQLYKMYVKNMPKHLGPDGYVRPSFGIRHTDSGRFNCTNPSLHTIPWHSIIKRMFVSRFKNGLILSADHAQMELRVFAMATQDPQLIQTFKDGKDIHRMISSRVLQCREEDVPSDERRRIKTVVFGLLYGRGPKSIAAQEGISVERAQEIIAGVFKQFPKVKSYIKKVHDFVRKHGYVNYINGFRRIIPVDQDDPARAQRQAVNTTIQGPASDLAVAGMINMRNKMQRLKLYSKHWEFKHDDLAYDVAPGELLALAHLIQTEMVRRPSMEISFIGEVPLKVDFEVGINWGQAVEMSIVNNTHLEFSGEEEHVAPLLERLQAWPDPPREVSREVEVKKKTAVVRSLMKSTGEMVDYNHITVTYEFPKFVRREPDWAHPGLIQAA